MTRMASLLTESTVTCEVDVLRAIEDAISRLK